MRFMIEYVVKNANKVFASENQDVDCLLRAGAAPFNDAIFAFRWVERGRESAREREKEREERKRRGRDIRYVYVCIELCLKN